MPTPEDYILPSNGRILQVRTEGRDQWIQIEDAETGLKLDEPIQLGWEEMKFMTVDEALARWPDLKGLIDDIEFFYLKIIIENKTLEIRAEWY